MNGCELPGGTVLTVEPSDPSYKQRKDRLSDGNHYGRAIAVPLESASHTLHPTDAVVTNTSWDIDRIEATEDREVDDDGNDDENLDDFFASLE